MQKRISHKTRVAAKRTKLAILAIGLTVVVYFLVLALFRFIDRSQVRLEIRNMNTFFSWERSWQTDDDEITSPKSQGAACVLASDGKVRFSPGAKQEGDAFYMSANECRATLARVMRPVPNSSNMDEAALWFPPQPISCDGQPCPLFSIIKKAKEAKSPKAIYELSIPTWRRVLRSTASSSSSFSSPPQQVVQATAVSPPADCPTAYATVQLQGFGRMQNQMQSLVNGMLWSQHLHRTFVLPPLCWNITCCWDPACHSRLNVEQFYDFSSWRAAGFCVINYDTFLRANAKEEATTGMSKQLRFYYHAKDQKHEHPLLNMQQVRLDDFMVSSEAADLPKSQQDNSTDQTSYRITSERFYELTVHALKGEAEQNRTEEWLVLSAATAFFVRFPLAATQQLFGLLRPSPHVQERVRAILASSPQGFATVGFHLRSREGTCRYEALTLASKLGPSGPTSPLSVFMSEAFEKEVLWECTPNEYGVLSRAAYSAEQVQLAGKVKKDMKTTTGASLADGTPTYRGLSFLVATDQQSKAVMLEVQNKWEKLYPDWLLRNLAVTRDEKEFGRLASDVAVDFFVLAAADVFWGNRLSAVSQNVCMWRLYNGKACYGFAGGVLSFNFQNV